MSITDQASPGSPQFLSTMSSNQVSLQFMSAIRWPVPYEQLQGSAQLWVHDKGSRAVLSREYWSGQSPV